MTLLKKCVAAESAVSSGKVTISQQESRVILNEDKIRERGVGDSKRLGIELEWNRNHPEVVQTTATVLFDNNISVYKTLTKSKLPTVAEKSVYFSPEVYKVYVNDTKNRRRDLGVYPAHWPPGWPGNVFRNRFWAERLRLVTNNTFVARVSPSTERGVVLLELIGNPSKKSTIDQRIWVDPSKGYTPKRVEFWDKPEGGGAQPAPFSGRLAERCDFVYQKHVQGIWYLHRLEDSFISPVTGKPGFTVSSTVADPGINVALTSVQLSPDKPVEGTIIQDERFPRPIVYTQGKKQYSDADMLAVNQGTLTLEYQGEQLKNSGPFPNITDRFASIQISLSVYIGIFCFLLSGVAFVSARYVAKKEIGSNG